MPELTVERDPLNWGILGFTGVIALASILQTCFMIRAANAAKRSADALVNIERPWVMIQTKVEMGTHPSMAEFTLSAFNYGKSPAHIIACDGPRVEVVAEPGTLPIPPKYGAWDWDQKFLAPKDSMPLRDAVHPWEVYTTALQESVARGQAMPRDNYILVYGLIKYSDGMSDRIYKTAYCYSLKRDQFADMGETLVPVGPREYNSYT